MTLSSYKILFFFIFSLTIILYISEFALRISGVYKTQSEKGSGQFINPYKVQHTGLYYYHTPSRKIKIDVNEFSYTHQYNSLGHREINSLKKVDIIALGDSFTEGLGASQDSTWTSLLALQLEQTVYNAGVMGSDMFYNFMDLKYRLINLNPQKIIYMVNYSDIYDILLRGGMERFQNDGSVIYSDEPWYLPVYESSHLFRAFIHMVLGYDFMFNASSDRKNNIERTIKKMADLLIESQSFCNEKGIEMYVFIHPIPQEYYKNLDRRINFREIDKIQDFLISSKVNCINLRPDFEQVLLTRDNWKSISWENDGHFNSKGYKLMADLIYNKIFRKN